VDRAVPREAARLRAHAVFGLLNSTPHSAARSRGQAARELSGMALRALVGPDVQPAEPTVPHPR
jgi:hypothetical protein